LPASGVAFAWEVTPLALVTETTMLDAMYLAIGFGFLAVAVLYVVACDRL
jgi:hypothetical protein